MKPHQAAYGKSGSVSGVDANTNANQKVGLTADKSKVETNARVEGTGDFNAKRDGGPEEIKVRHCVATCTP